MIRLDVATVQSFRGIVRITRQVCTVVVWYLGCNILSGISTDPCVPNPSTCPALSTAKQGNSLVVHAPLFDNLHGVLISMATSTFHSHTQS